MIFFQERKKTLYYNLKKINVKYLSNKVKEFFKLDNR